MVRQLKLRAKWSPYILILALAVCYHGLAPPAAAAGPELAPGGRGEEVKILQGKLKEMGYYPPGEITGYFGLTTYAAVTAFEKAAGLAADGVVGEAEWRLLFPGGPPGRGGSGGDRDQGIGATKLNKLVLGYYTEDYPGDKLSYESLWHNAGSIDAIATFNYLVDGEGNLTGQPISQGVSLAASKKVKSLMLIHNIHNSIDTAAAHRVLALESSRNRLVNNIFSLIKKHGFSGVNIDLEGVPAADRPYYNVFLAELKERFRPYGYLLTVSIPGKTSDSPSNSWSGAYDYAFIGRTADLVAIMTYDEHWSGGPPGPIASQPWVRQVLDYAVKTMPREKILVGIAAYGYDWSATGSRAVRWNEAEALAAKYGGVRWSDRYSSPYFTYFDAKGVRHEVWFENKTSLGLKLDLVNSYKVAGIAVWRLGFDDVTFWQTVRGKFS